MKYVAQVVGYQRDRIALVGHAEDEPVVEAGKWSTMAVPATPRAAVSSSRIVSCQFHDVARATATDWRWPPESDATAWRVERTVRGTRAA
ncbi:MAG TPA: hypothetical protein VME46_18980 [Acidimicrobiales bacterium]|nr:hypothetical protein [Acidimicrobiales bacterium]